MLMAHSWDRMEAGCRTFDVRRTPVCVGAIPEVFRTWPGVVRSLHPTHSVAVLGPRAGDLVAGHEQSATPCGADTPYDRALRDDGQILLLGVGLESNTAFHTIEALANVPYLMRDEPDPFEIIDDSGTSRHLAVSRHRPGIPRRFAALEDVLVAHGLATRGLVGRATARLVAGAAFRDFMIQRLHDDPGYLLAHPEGLPADRTERSEIDARHDP
jgi:aminoglycoside 3-N-acetyltransferase